MGLPYFLFARGLRSVSPQEAGAITLLEPVLNPLWAYLIAPETDTPTVYTAVGGVLIVGALAYRYLTVNARKPELNQNDGLTVQGHREPGEIPKNVGGLGGLCLPFGRQCRRERLPALDRLPGLGLEPVEPRLPVAIGELPHAACGSRPSCPCCCKCWARSHRSWAFVGSAAKASS